MAWNKKFRTLSIHVAAWLCFIAYEVSVTLTMGSKAGFADFAAFYILNICLFYFNSELVFRFASNLKNVALVIIPLVLIELTAYIILGLILSHYLDNSQTSWSQLKTNPDDIISALWRGMYFIGLSTGYWLFKRTIAVTREANELRILQLEVEKSKAETEKNLAITQIAYLRSQINPHFLFNTLNYIYNAVDEVSPKASEGILLLSDIMRYSFAETTDDGKVYVADEIAHIERFIVLTQRRFSNELFLSFESHISDGCRQCKIPPLILFTFVENVLKHGNLGNSKEPARIVINCSDGILNLQTLNLVRNNPVRTAPHIGIENTRTRLSLTYSPDQFNLLTENTPTHFIVKLSITISP